LASLSVGMTTLTIRNTGGTDHLSFDAVGLPGFQFVQDPVEYETRTHHSNMDVYDHASEPDLKQAATIVAAFAYLAANRAELLPRKPLPPAKPAPAVALIRRSLTVTRAMPAKQPKSKTPAKKATAKKR